MHWYFRAVLHMDEIVMAFDANQFTLDMPGTTDTPHPIVYLLVRVILKALPIRDGISFHHV
jgi:hypothetical protein